jgi:hypothetical protein
MDYRKMRRIGQYYRTHNKPSPFHNIDELIGRFDIDERIVSSIANKHQSDSVVLNTTNETFGQMISSMIENENKSLDMINMLSAQLKLNQFKIDNMSHIIFHTIPPDPSTYPPGYNPNPHVNPHVNPYVNPHFNQSYTPDSTQIYLSNCR